MTHPELQRAARAIAEVRGRYEIVPRHVDLHGVWTRDDHAGFQLPFVFSAETKTECQAWIDEQAARACFESVLPVSNEMVQAAIDEDVAHQGMVSEREVITAAIRHITTGGDNT